MLRRIHQLAILTALVLALAGCTALPNATPTEESAPEARAIVLGDISDDPAEVIEGAQPLANYLAGELSEFGVTEGQVRVAADNDQMAEMLRSGEVDLYFDSVYPATLIHDTTGATPILRRWRNGVAEYHSVIFATQESDVESVEDLRGRMVAMDQAYSTSGYALAVVYLDEHGLQMSVKDSPDAAVGPDEIGIVFTYDDENTFAWVADGRVDAGVTDDFHFGQFSQQADLVSLAETESVPRQVVIVRPGLDPDFVEAIKQALLAADESEAGQAALEAFDDTAQFDEFPEGIDQALARMREMQAIVEEVSATAHQDEE
jgi:phosphonate transport system substrate-binding protein